MRVLKPSFALLLQAKFYSTCGVFMLLALVCLAGRSTHAQKTGTSNRPAAATTATAPAPERTRLETVEDLCESLANDLLELSIATRDRDLERTAEFFPAKLTAAPYPSRLLELKNQIKWVNTHGWTGDAPDINVLTRNGTLPPLKSIIPGSESAKISRMLTRQKFLPGWSEFLAPSPRSKTRASKSRKRTSTGSHRPSRARKSRRR